jgi:putative transcriptional regulator
MNELMQRVAGEITLSKNPGAGMRKWREIFGITQTELAEYLKITPSTISDYESNRRKSPGIAVVRRFIHSLVEIDRKRGAWVVKKLTDENKESIFEVHEFPKTIDALEFIAAIKGRIVTNKRRIATYKVNGYSLIDSLRAILELPVDEFPDIYGSSTDRALVFTKVSIGRSPMVAIRVTKFKPSIVVFQGLKEVDVLAKKISEVEKVPIVLTDLSPLEIESNLTRYEE